MYVQPFEGPLGPNPLASFAGLGESENALAQAFAPGAETGDAISRLVPPWLSQGAMQNPAQTALFGPLPGLMQQMMQMLQWMMSSLQGAPYGSGASCTAPGNEQFFGSASGASQGDPHLSFNGNKWNSMASQPDLLDSDCIPGGLRVSTQVTPPNAKGVAWNRSATVSLNNGATTVSLDRDGQATIQNLGQNVAVAPGQTVSLGNGASVTRNANGSLSVVAQNGSGGQITTTLGVNGQGVDVSVSAQNVDLGGTLVNAAQTPTPPQPPVPPFPGMPQLPPLNARPNGA
jgi:hypothetical protein